MNQSPRIVLILFACSAIIYTCTYSKVEPKSNTLSVKLRWVPDELNQTRGDVITGLAWALSYLGAELPRGSLASAVIWKNEDTFELKLSEVGFSHFAIAPLEQYLEVLKASDEYRVAGGIDLGRFVALSINSSYHYYAITGAKRRLAQFEQEYDFVEKKAAITNSAIAQGHRLIKFTTPNHASRVAFLAAEGKGSLFDQSFEPKSFECMDVMPNGQLRFSIYNEQGFLKAASDTLITMAGKTAKCIWCHEINVQPLFDEQQDVDGLVGREELQSLIADSRELIVEFRQSLKSEIDFSRSQDHTKMELLYISFFEPSAKRLAFEWGMSEEQVSMKLKSLPTHRHHEFPQLGNLFNRADVDALAPYSPIPVSTSAREKSQFEPNFIDWD